MLSKTKSFFEEDLVKDQIEKLLYSSAGMISNVVTLSGPNCERHIKNLRHTVAISRESTITLVDINKDVHQLHKDWLQKNKNNWKGRWETKTRRCLKLIHNVNATLSNIADVKPERFIDADFMASYKTAGVAFKTIFHKQQVAFKDNTRKKAIIFTFCVRNARFDNTFAFVQKTVKDELDADITILKKCSLHPWSALEKGKKRYFFIRQICRWKGDRVVNVEMYYYGNNMFTGIIVYK